MRIDILTLFPDAVDAMMHASILGRAQERGYITIRTHQIRNFTTNKQMQVDDYPYGGGRGAVMQADPLYRCWAHVCEEAGSRGHTIYLSPCGRTFTQSVARELKETYDHLILVCGHYEGIDQRFIDECVDEEISMGDFVVTGGEIPAMALADAVCRMVPGVLPDEECFTEESHWNGLLEYPQYSRPDEWHGRRVPDVLLSGHHGNVEKWRRKQSYIRTMLRRPDLWAQFDESVCKTKGERKLLAEAKAEALAIAEKLKACQVKIAAKGGEGGKLFGAVTGKEIAAALKEQYGMDVDSKKLVLDQPIKTFGSFEIKAKLGFEISGTVYVLVTEEK